MPSCYYSVIQLGICRIIYLIIKYIKSHTYLEGKKDNYENQVAALEKAFTSTSLLMQHGNTTYLEVLTARQTLLNAQLSQTANCFKEIQSLINLYQALGGGQHI